MNRPLTEVETKLIERLLRDTGRADLIRTLAERLVQEMEDGGMGSLAFQPALGRRFGAEAAAIDFSDVDGVKVSAALNLDEAGDLFELDVWKTDFTPLLTLSG